MLEKFSLFLKISFIYVFIYSLNTLSLELALLSWLLSHSLAHLLSHSLTHYMFVSPVDRYISSMEIKPLAAVVQVKAGKPSN